MLEYEVHKKLFVFFECGGQPQNALEKFNEMNYGSTHIKLCWMPP
jgi:hypothetical protein